MESKQNIMNYMVMNEDNKTIFLHELNWVINNEKPIPNEKLVFHKDGNTLNNHFSNLDLVDENKDFGDLHEDKNKIFHEKNYQKNENFIKKHFPEIYKILFKN